MLVNDACKQADGGPVSDLLGSTLTGTITLPASQIVSFSFTKPLSQPEPFDLLAAMTGKPLRFRSGCDVRFVAYIPDAKPHCQLVLLNPQTGNVVTRYANGKSSTEPYAEPGDIFGRCLTSNHRNLHEQDH